MQTTAPPTRRLFHNMASSLGECLKALEFENKPTFPSQSDGKLWCNATWDTFLCWPAIPANTSISLPCPPLKGLLPEKQVTKHCHESGQWAGRNQSDFSRLDGYTDYSPCMKIDHEFFDASAKFASSVRKFEFAGLSISFVTLIIMIMIFSFFKKLQRFRSQLHKQMMIVQLVHVIIRLILYIDLAIIQTSDDWKWQSLHNWTVICKGVYIVLEYCKTAVPTFVLIEGIYLFKAVVMQSYKFTKPSLWNFCCFGWGFPVVLVSIWLCDMMVKGSFTMEKCLGEYYMAYGYWIQDLGRILFLVINICLLLGVARTIFCCYNERKPLDEYKELKKHFQEAFLLTTLICIPFILQYITYTPTRDNMQEFIIVTYASSFVVMFQGAMVSMLYFLANIKIFYN